MNASLLQCTCIACSVTLHISPILHASDINAVIQRVYLIRLKLEKAELYLDCISDIRYDTYRPMLGHAVETERFLTQTSPEHLRRVM